MGVGVLFIIQKIPIFMLKSRKIEIKYPKTILPFVRIAYL